MQGLRRADQEQRLFRMQSTRGQVHLLDKEEIAAFALRTRMWESRNIPTHR